jgi:signal recognition particle subunit SRP54
MVVGLNGAGKTTTSAKLALRLKNEGRRPVLIACDLIRPAAIDQLATLAQQIDVPVYCPEAGERDVIKVARAGLAWAKDQNATVTIIDTAGRQEVDEALIDELKQLHSFVDPRETLLVVDSATGQQAVQVAQTFDQAVSVTGIVLTKLDGDARGGAALSMRSVTGKPIKFAGEGEKLDQFGPFYPDRMADRILGMGDIVGLVEKAAANIDEKKATKSVNRFMSGQFDFNDFLDQMKMIQNLGPLEGLLGLLPGFNKIKKQLPADAFDPKKMKHVEAMILSMTPEERSNPDVMNMSRRRRIAKGSGLPIEKVNQNIKRFMEMRKMMSGKGPMGALMKQMRGGQGGKKGKGTPQLPANMKLPDLSSMSGLGGLGGLGGLFRKK